MTTYVNGGSTTVDAPTGRERAKGWLATVALAAYFAWLFLEHLAFAGHLAGWYGDLALPAATRILVVHGAWAIPVAFIVMLAVLLGKELAPLKQRTRFRVTFAVALIGHTVAFWIVIFYYLPILQQWRI